VPDVAADVSYCRHSPAERAKFGAIQGSGGIAFCNQCHQQIPAPGQELPPEPEPTANQAMHGQAQIKAVEVVTTDAIPGRPTVRSLGLVAVEGLHGLGVGRDIAASARDVVGGRSGTIERAFAEAREIAMKDLRKEVLAAGGNAAVGARIERQVVTPGATASKMVLVAITATAVVAGDAAAGPQEGA
jgi:uncharacterized protein YbjQ (UPF0145 family)